MIHLRLFLSQNNCLFQHWIDEIKEQSPAACCCPLSNTDLAVCVYFSYLLPSTPVRDNKGPESGRLTITFHSPNVFSALLGLP